MNTITDLNDIHFWVEKDGKIIDPDFPVYDMIKSIQGLEGEKQFQELTDKRIIKIYMKHWIEKGTTNLNVIGLLGVMPHQCYSNAMYYISQNGGKLKIGKMGWKKKNSNKIWWEFG